MRAVVVAFVSGALFAIGLAVGGMTQPAKVVGFLDFTGHWDPSLAFVMAGAIGVYFRLYRWISRRSAPVFAAQYLIPTRRDLDAKLITGAALFGVGWGLAGFCPGPALASIGSATSSVLIFVAAMLLGMFLHHVSGSLFRRPADASGPCSAASGRWGVQAASSHWPNR